MESDNQFNHRPSTDGRHQTHPSPEGSPSGPRSTPQGGSADRPWSARWTQLGRSAGLLATDPVLVALSGGADSVYLLHLVARSEPRPKVMAVHVEHGLRGGEGQQDSAFCARLCARLGVPFARRMLHLESGSNLEARAREGRYTLLAEEARRAGIAHIVTGHHEDDALETLLMRMMRGSALPGLPGLKNRLVLPGDPPVSVHRPLLPLRREEVRRLLRDADLDWREDSSNLTSAHTRNRVRNGLLPDIEAACGPEGLDGLRAFAQAVESLEDELAQRTAHLAWDERPGAPASLPRTAVTGLAEPLRRRALWRLLQEGTGLPPTRTLLGILLDDFAQDRVTQRSLPGGWTLDLEDQRLVLHEPDARHPIPVRDAGLQDAQSLDTPGSLDLPDGRSLHAELVTRPPGSPVPQLADEVELDAAGLDGIALTVRTALPGDRFHGLGAPGSRPLVRFLADAGIPASQRGQIPLVFAGEELIWVAGLRPSETCRVTGGTTHRLRLRLTGIAAEAAQDPGLPSRGGTRGGALDVPGLSSGRSPAGSDRTQQGAQQGTGAPGTNRGQSAMSPLYPAGPDAQNGPA